MPDPETVRRVLDDAGLSVDAIRRDPQFPATVVVGRVLEAGPHPNADRLKVTKVDTGDGKPRTIVCGAPNVMGGQKVVVALPGTVLPNGMTIKSAAIRGVMSDGMICATDELGLGSDHTGILVLPENAAVGRRADTVLPSRETVYSVAVTPNRPDCLSVLGLSREIAAATKRKVITPAPDKKKRAGRSPIIVRIKESKHCPYYSAQFLTDVKVVPSPDWMAERLQAAGVRPINAVVDITNYVMLELGEPLHAFNAAAVEGKTIIVRRALAGERFRSLDGVERALTPTMLVIADAKKPVAIAGVMGGEQSGITDATTQVVLEAAHFDRQSVYNTSRTLRLVSESSQRFSKGVDPAIVPVALARATQLFVELCGATVTGAPAVAGRMPRAPKGIPMRLAWMNAFLGTDLGRPAVVTLLRRLQCRTTGSGDRMVVYPPSYRYDLVIAEDIAEEVARLHGFNTIRRAVPSAPGRPVPLPPMSALVRDCTDRLIRLGAHQHVGYAYVPEDYVREEHASAVKILNPLSRDQEYLRTSLLPQLFALAAKNAKRVDTFRVFEFGKEYRKSAQGYEEKEVLALLWVQPDALRALKGAVEYLVERTCATKPSFRLHGPSIDLVVGNVVIGMLKVPTQAERTHGKLPDGIAVAVLDLALLLERCRFAAPHFRPIPFYPPVKRDLAMWVDAKTPYADVHAILAQTDPLLVDVELFDVYSKNGRKSFAFHLTFQAQGRTLRAGDIDAVMQKLAQRLTERVHATIRSSTETHV